LTRGKRLVYNKKRTMLVVNLNFMLTVENGNDPQEAKVRGKRKDRRMEMSVAKFTKKRETHGWQLHETKSSQQCQQWPRR
jgi:hypothetical protein